MPSIVFEAKTEADVQQCLAICYANDIIVIPSAGRSSLEGHLIPMPSYTRPVCVLDTSAMDKIIKVNENDMDVIVEPGVNWVELNEALEEKGLFFPNDPGLQAQIGGMCSTNCSGTLAFKYGTISKNVLGLRVVLADGRVIQTKHRPHKSSAGYDLTRLFVGSEGTLGVITRATLKLQKLPKFNAIILVQFEDLTKAAEFAAHVVVQGLQLERIEFMDHVALKSINQALGSKVHKELATILIDCAGSSKAMVQEQVQELSKISQKHNAAHFATKSDKEGEQLWKIRKGAFFSSKTLRPDLKKPHVLTTDCAVPISRLPQFLKATRDDLDQSKLCASIVAHAGDGNVHCLIVIDDQSEKEVEMAEAFRERNAVLAIDFEGTCTGEHGVGQGKRELLLKELGPDAVDLMRKIKKTLDPKSILNPEKVFPLVAKL